MQGLRQSLLNPVQPVPEKTRDEHQQARLSHRRLHVALDRICPDTIPATRTRKYHLVSSRMS
jgi:hypothetical protein